MNLVRYFYGRSKLALSLSLMLAIAGGLAGTALIKMLTDGLTGSDLSFGFGVAFFGLCALLFATRSCTQLLILRLTQNAVFDMRLRITGKILGSPLRKLEEIGSPKLLVILSKDVENFANSLQIAPHLLASVVVVVFCLAYLAWLSWVWFLLFSAALVVCFFLFRLAQRFPNSQIRLVRERLDIVYRLFRDLLEGTKELQLNKPRGDHFLSEMVEPEARQYKATFIRGFSAFIWITNVGDVTFYVVIGLLLFVVPDWLSLPMTAELRVKIGVTLMYLIGPISTISNAMPALGQASIALEKIQKLDADLDTSARQQTVAIDPFGASTPFGLQLELTDVVYEYAPQGDGKRFLLGPVSLNIPQGQISFIVGANGTGKSTLAKILSGLYLPVSGHIALNGVPVIDGNLDHYRRRFSAVFSDFYLFDHLMGVGGSDGTDSAAGYLKKLKIDHKVSLNEGRFSTIDLSNGQKKRLALIISYLEDRPIYLFDEWAADQDPAFKNFFYKELLPELKHRGKTIIAITHDDAYFHCADLVFRIDEITPGPIPPLAEDLELCSG